MTVTAEQYQTDCSKYVYDAAQDKLTLPNITGRVLQGGESVKSIEAGLPNVTGTIYMREMLTVKTTGAFSQSDEYSPRAYRGDGDGVHTTVRLDASRSNPIYGRSDIVQPPALHLIAQIKY